MDGTDIGNADNVWYFAYGSNMRGSVMENRGVKIVAEEGAVVLSHVLRFDIFGVPYSEPAMASIAPVESLPSDQTKMLPPPVHGVAYLVSHADYVRLLVSEGAGTAYEEIELQAQLLDPSKNVETEAARVITVKTLVARYPFRQSAPPRPSARYLVRWNPYVLIPYILTT